MPNIPVTNDAAECPDMAHRCLIEANRTLNRETAATMRNLAERYFEKAAGRRISERRRPGGHMQERRLYPRRRVLKSGRILRSGNRAGIECAICNVSDAGACLQISLVHDLSTDFALVMGDSSHSGRVVWRTRDRSGISYGRD
jgi:hypothetical protein